MITVVAALIENDNKYLIAKRRTGDPNNLGKWEFPGGKVEKNESEEDAIVREMAEEFEISIKPISFVANHECVYPDKTIDLHLYKCQYLTGEFKLNDHSDYVWVTSDEMKSYDLALADKYLIEDINL